MNAGHVEQLGNGGRSVDAAMEEAVRLSLMEAAAQPMPPPQTSDHDRVIIDDSD